MSMAINGDIARHLHSVFYKVIVSKYWEEIVVTVHYLT